MKPLATPSVSTIGGRIHVIANGHKLVLTEDAARDLSADLEVEATDARITRTRKALPPGDGGAA